MQTELFEVEISGKRKVRFQSLKASDMLRSQALAGLDNADHKVVVSNKMALAGLQLAITEVAGEKLTFDETRKRWDELVTYRDQQILLAAWTRVNYPEEGEGNAVPVT